MRQWSGKKPQNIKKTLRALGNYLGRHKMLLVVVAVLVTISAVANLLGTFMIKPVVNTFIAQDGGSKLIVGVLITAAIYFSGALSALGYTQTMVNVAQKIIYDIRRDLLSHVQKLPLRYFDTTKTGDVMSLFTNDVDTISDALNNSFATLIQNSIQAVGTLILLFVLNWQLSIVVAVCYFAMIMYIRFSGKKSKMYFNRQQNILGEMDGYIEEMINGQKVIKVFNHEEENLSGFKKRCEELRRAGTGANTYAETMLPAVVTLSYINYAIVAVLGGIMAIRGQTDVGSLASYLVFVRQAAMPINQVTQQSNFILSALAGAERIFNTMEKEPEVDEGDVQLVNIAEKDGVITESEKKTGKWAWKGTDGGLTPLRGDVRLKNVTFGYEPGHTILHDVSLYAKPGQKIAFVGATGAGKTTITNLINRFYDVTEGQIVFDGQDVREIKKDSLRRSLGIVLQDTHLFNGTIADNIRFGKLNATMDEVVAAAKTANAHSFIRRLPKGYDTMVLSDGANLSQGQRQLLAIARVAVADPPVLILDEATSSIDTRTEALIEKGMDRLMEGRTVFVIAHRLSTVRNANAIMVMENGRIVERGDHDELLLEKGLYYKLYTGLFELS